MTRLTRLDSYQRAEKQWLELLTTSSVDSMFITPQWLKVWWDQFGDGAEMFLLCLENQDGIEGIAPLSRRNGTISFIGSQDVCDYDDFPISPGAELRFYNALVDHLEEEEWDTIELPSLIENSPTLAYLPDIARTHGYHVEVDEEDVSPGVVLPDSWDDYLGLLSKKDRHELRRKLRRLDSVGGGFCYYGLSDPEEIENCLDDFFSLMKSSKEVKRRFLTESRETFFRNIARETASTGVFRLFFMEINGERVATAMCFDYGRARMLYNSGFNPAYRAYSVGLLLKALCLGDAIKEGKQYFDFLRGSEPYKYDLGGQNRTVYHMVVKRT